MQTSLLSQVLVLIVVRYCTCLAVLASNDQSLPVRESIVQELNITGAIRTVLTYPTPLWLCSENSRESKWLRLSLICKRFIVPQEPVELLHADIEATTSLVTESIRDTYDAADEIADNVSEALLDDPSRAYRLALIGELKEKPKGCVHTCCLLVGMCGDTSALLH